MKNKNSYRIDIAALRSVVRDSSLSPLARLVLINLLLYAGVDNNAFPSEETLGKDMGRSARQVRSQLKKLQQNGHIQWKRKGYSGSNRYVFSEEIYFRNDNNSRKPSSSQIGNSHPMYTGTTFPPTVNQEDSQINNSQLLQQFEKANKGQVSELVKNQFLSLCKQHDISKIKKALDKAIATNLPYITPGYLVRIIQDYEKFGEPPPQPTFMPCGRNGCEGGYINNPNKNSYTICACRQKYEEDLALWKQKWEERS